jgi:TonB family protein
MRQQATAPQFDLFSERKAVAPPRLLVDWQPFWPQFLRNLADACLREPLPVPLAFAPGRFWPDVFVDRPIPWKDFGRSAILHSAALLLILTTGKFWIFPATVTVRQAFDNTTLTYYKVDDVLPQVKSAPALRPRAKTPQKGQPELAKQEVISVPANADNAEQTIVNPPHPQIVNQTQPLPDLLVSTVVPAPPVAALSHTRVTLPEFLIKPIQPTPDVRTTRARSIKIPLPDAVQPAATADDLHIRTEIKLLVAKMEPTVEVPKLPEPPLPAAKASAPQHEAVPPPPSTQGLSGASKAAGQLMVLNVRPVAPPAEINIPNGSRAGVFAATPNGKAGAPGTPDIQGAPADTNESGSNGRAGNSGSAPSPGVPAGVSVSCLPLKPHAAVVLGVPAALPPKPEETRIAPARAFAAAASPDFGRKTFPPYVSSPERKPEDTVFAGKKYYSMQLNMPNLTSAAGSWIIRFAELNDDHQAGDLSTPVVTDKVDPAYPAELMREQVEGTVILYAVIHADGTVGDVRVLQSLHQDLDANAIRALGRWHFRPATKNGVPVDLEAVVRIPFKARKGSF